ncbi:MAG: MerR family DNA-binding protein, partial [Desulfuromonadales bacterium]|nr:MerR family DNA-binding protein [Desulfuromonadales bacterium]
SLGFSIEECRELLSLYQDRSRSSADVKHVAQQRVDHIDRKIAELKGMRDTLEHLIAECHGDHMPDCPILDDLASA